MRLFIFSIFTASEQYFIIYFYNVNGLDIYVFNDIFMLKVDLDKENCYNVSFKVNRDFKDKIYKIFYKLY